MNCRTSLSAIAGLSISQISFKVDSTAGKLETSPPISPNLSRSLLRFVFISSIPSLIMEFLETPSRVMRRIDDLEQQSLPDLPDLPDMSEMDYTLPESPPQPANRRRSVLSPSPPPKRAPSPATNNRAASGPPTPYTSTPAPSSYQRSQSTVVPSATSSRHSNDSTATILGKPPPRSLSQHLSARRGTGYTLKEGAEMDFPSFEDEGMEIERVNSLEDQREDMVVASSSSGTESDRPRTKQPRRAYSLSPARVDQQEPEEDHTASSSNSLDSYFGKTVEPSEIPLPSAINDSHEYSVPLSGDDSNRQDGITASARARRLSAASANISIRRKAHRQSAAAVKQHDEENSSPENESRDNGLEATMPSAFSPLRERDSNTSTLPSPGMGRHASPVSSPHHSFASPHSTPGQVKFEKSESAPLSRVFATPGGLNDPDSPPVAFSSAAAQRRASHLLTTLRSTAKPRFAKGTPHPTRLHASPASDAGAGGPEGSFASDISSSNDLTTLHHGQGNTSLPSGGGGTALEGRSTRFNGAKLNAYLHTLNTHLTDENQSLVKTLSGTTQEVERLRKQTKKLENQVREMSMSGMASRIDQSDDEGERSRVEVLEKQLEGLVESHEGINVLQQQLVNELGGSAPSLAVPSPAHVARLNELEALVTKLTSQVADKDAQIDTLREDVVKSRSPSSSAEDPSLVHKLQREVFELKDSLSEAEADRDARAEEVVKLREQFTAAGEANEAALTSLHARADELLLELEGRDAELEQARNELGVQEAEFAEKMKDLEVELCRVMEEQEEGVEKARKEVEDRRKEEENMVDQLKAKVAALEEEVKAVKEERDGLEVKIALGAADEDAAERTKELREQVEQHQETVNHLEQEVIPSLEAHIASLESTLAARDSTLSQLESAVDSVKADNAVKEEEIRRLTSDLEDVASEETDSKRQIEEHLENLAQMEEALDESARQLIQNEDEMETLRVQLASEKSVVASLSAQISQLSLTKAKSPLANEAYNGNKESIIHSLEEELEEAQAEIQQLKEQLAAANEDKTKATIEIQDLQIKTLETHKADLEGRVNTLRQQVSVQLSPRKTPDKSMLFRSIIGIQTPRTPGQFMSNLTAWSPGSAADQTISPLLAQIHELEQVVGQLQEQLAEANENIDDKLDRLEASGSGTISLARQLSEARARVAQLEADLEKLLGDQGSMQRVKTRLSKLSCPECEHSFDANKLVQLRISRSGISFSEPKSPQLNESLRTALAGVNAKLSELRTENGVLQGASDRAKELATEKAAIVRQHAALQKDFQQARSEIAGLEVELRTERTRLQALANEQALSTRNKSSLEARLAAAESELRIVKRDLASAVKPDVVERLRREKADLIAERADLLQKLNAVNERTSAFDADLNSTKKSQASMQAQLDRQIAEIAQLRDSLQSREAEKRLLTDERGDILRGVAGLQADLNRVRQDAVSLGLDLAAVRRERDEVARQGGGASSEEVAKLKEELRRARRKLGVFEQKVAEHVCPSDANAMLEMRARHSEEAKGLLSMISYFQRRIVREVTFRESLSDQKLYLNAIVQEKQSTIDLVMGQLGVPTSSSDTRRAGKPRPSLRSVALAVISLNRMSSGSRAWKKEQAVAKRMRVEVYPQTRGRPFPYPV